MNRLTFAQRTFVAKALLEGNSLRATARMTGVARMTVEKLLHDLSVVCTRYQDQHLRNLSCKRIQCDDIWSFVYARQENVPAEKQGAFRYGDVWTWVAMDVETKVAVSWIVGDRGAATAFALMDDIASRLSHRVQLTTEGHRVYLNAVERAFVTEVDYSVLVKLYGADRDKEATYSPAQGTGCRNVSILGNPEPKHVSTCFQDQHNLSMRRSTRLTNALNKKVENHAQSVAFHFMHYNFTSIHHTLRGTPAMAAGIADAIWTIEDIVALLQH